MTSIRTGQNTDNSSHKASQHLKFRLCTVSCAPSSSNPTQAGMPVLLKDIDRTGQNTDNSSHKASQHLKFRLCTVSCAV